MSQYKIHSERLIETITLLKSCQPQLKNAESAIYKCENSLFDQKLTAVSKIKYNIKNARRKVHDLAEDLSALQESLLYIGDKSEDADRQVSNVLRGRGYMNIIDDARDVMGDLNKRFQDWRSISDEDNQAGKKNQSEKEIETHVLVLNDSQNKGDEDTIQQIEVRDPVSYVVEDNVIKIYVPGIGYISLYEYPVDSKYPNSYTVVINGVSTYLAGAQCLGFARYVHEKMYGDHHINGENDSFTRTYYNIARGTLNAGTFKQLIMQSGVGAHIRTNAKTAGGWGHSMIVPGITEEGLTIIDANGDGNGTVAAKTYTWDEYMLWWGNRGIEYIETFNG